MRLVRIFIPIFVFQLTCSLYGQSSSDPFYSFALENSQVALVEKGATPDIVIIHQYKFSTKQIILRLMYLSKTNEYHVEWMICGPQDFLAPIKSLHWKSYKISRREYEILKQDPLLEFKQKDYWVDTDNIYIFRKWGWNLEYFRIQLGGQLAAKSQFISTLLGLEHRLEFEQQ